MSTWVGMAPVIGSSSLDGFAIGALMSGACALAITAPRRAQARQAPTARDGSAPVAERSGWLCEHVMAAEAVWPVAAAEAFEAGMAAEANGPVVAVEAGGGGGAGGVGGGGGAGAERLARPDELGALGPGRSAVGREGRSGYRSRHRLRGPPSRRAPPGDG